MRLDSRRCVAACLPPGCASLRPLLAQNRVEQQLILELRDLHEENRQLLTVLNSLTDQLKTVNGKIDAEANARSKGFADQQTLVNNANSAVSALQEQVSENKVQVQKLTQELDAVKKGVDMLTVMVTQALAQMPAQRRRPRTRTRRRVLRLPRRRPPAACRPRARSTTTGRSATTPSGSGTWRSRASRNT